VGKMRGVRLAQHLLQHTRRQRDGGLREARVAEYERKRAQLLQEAAMIEDAQRPGWELLSRKLRLEAEWFEQQVAHAQAESESI
jgi:hypothetical protein